MHIAHSFGRVAVQASARPIHIHTHMYKRTEKSTQRVYEINRVLLFLLIVVSNALACVCRERETLPKINIVNHFKIEIA